MCRIYASVNRDSIGSDMACRLFGAKPSSTKCWVIVNWTLRKELQWNLTRNTYIFIHENAFENVVRKLVAILSRPQCAPEWCVTMLFVHACVRGYPTCFAVCMLCVPCTMWMHNRAEQNQSLAFESFVLYVDKNTQRKWRMYVLFCTVC